MILVTTGTNGAPFDRLLTVVDRFQTDEEIIVQHGPSTTRPAGATCIEFLPFDRLGQLVEAARVVVTHAGVGSILLCLTRGRTPIVVPRLACFGEAVDDHQRLLACRLAADGVVETTEEPEYLPQLVRVHDPLASRQPVGGKSPIAADLNRYLDSVLA